MLTEDKEQEPGQRNMETRKHGTAGYRRSVSVEEEREEKRRDAKTE